MAHHQPDHLARMVRALAHPASYFFIHIDAKVPVAPFRTVIPESEHVVFLPDRVVVHWGTLSVVQALLRLLRAAAASPHAFRYYTVLSGSDYPIRSSGDVYARLHASDRQWIRIDRTLTPGGEGSHAHVLRALPGGKYFGAMTPCHGSMYWSLTADCIRFILDFVERNPAYVDVHDHVFAPDEIFFHTIVKHSPFAGAITHDFADGFYPDRVHHGNHFIDWAGLRAREHLTLDERDFDDLVRSHALFARKFDEDKSRELLAMLDEHVHGRV